MLQTALAAFVLLLALNGPASSSGVTPGFQGEIQVRGLWSGIVQDGFGPGQDAHILNLDTDLFRIDTARVVGSSGALQLPPGAQVTNLSSAFFHKSAGTTFTVGPFEVTLGVFRPGYDRRTFFYVHGPAAIAGIDEPLHFLFGPGTFDDSPLPYDLSILPGPPRVPLPPAIAALMLGLAALAGLRWTLRRTPA